MSLAEGPKLARSFYKTRFYSDCLGVFQGGGCRVAAFAGAHLAAHEAGVRFSEVAGTSGGAIVAALIAAGAEPEYLLQAVRSINFSDMLGKTREQVFPVKQKKHETLWLLCGGKTGSLLNGALRGGQYSSEPIAQWLELHLCKILNHRGNQPVQFDELLLPLYVMASDLTTMRPRIWSVRDTPTASVAHAVRASCSIPLFYQPVKEGSTLLVDGGLVSNLPHFVFANQKHSEHDRRILCFALEAEEKDGSPKDPISYLKRLVSLAIDGATDVQLRFKTDIGKVSITTGSVQATDMDKMDKDIVESLIESGKSATASFIRQEMLGATKLSAARASA